MLVIPGVWLLHWAIGDQRRFLDKEQRMASYGTWPLAATPLNGALTLLILMVLVSVGATHNLRLSLPKVSGMVLGFGLYFAVLRAGRHSSGWWWSLLLFLGFGLGVSLLGLTGMKPLNEADKIVSLNRIMERIPRLVAGLPGAEAGFHPNEVAGALTWVLPIFLTLSCYSLLPRRGLRQLDVETGNVTVVEMLSRLTAAQRRLVKIILWSGTLLIGVVFVLTQSRSGYIGMVLTCLVIVLIVLPRRGRRIALVLVLVTGLALVLLWMGEAPRFWERVAVGQNLTPMGGMLSTNSIDDRMKIWPLAISALADFPVTGMGMNTFREMSVQQYGLPRNSSQSDIAHAHNEFLQTGLDLGIPGLVAYMALHILAFWMAIRTWRLVESYEDSHRVFQQAIILGLGGGLLAHLLYGLTDAVALGAKPGVLLWVLLGLVASNYLGIESSRLPGG